MRDAVPSLQLELGPLGGRDKTLSVASQPRAGVSVASIVETVVLAPVSIYIVYTAQAQQIPKETKQVSDSLIKFYVSWD